MGIIGRHATGGMTPRNFEFDKTGNYVVVANQHSDGIPFVLRVSIYEMIFLLYLLYITSFKLDRESGTLTKVSAIDVPTPACVKFL